MGKLLEASELLNKRSDLETLKLAAELASKTENKDLFNAINMKIGMMEKKEVEPVDDKIGGIHICESRFEAILLKEQDKNSDKEDSNISAELDNNEATN